MCKVLTLISLLGWSLVGQAQLQPAAAVEVGGRPSFAEWRNVCAKLPSNRALRGAMPPKNLLPLPGFAEVDSALSEFFQQCKDGDLGQTNVWAGTCPSAAFFNTETAYFFNPKASVAALVKSLAPRLPNPPAPPFQPFAAKVQVPEE